MPAILSPFVEFARGMRTYWKGVQWLKNHPRFLVLLFLPMAVAFILFGVGFGFVVEYNETIFNYVLFDRPEGMGMLILYYTLKTILSIALFAMSLVLLVLIANVLASPIYEYVSSAVEDDVGTEKVAGLGFWKSILLLGEELKKVLFIVVLSIVMLLIPGLNIVATLITAFLIGWDFYDYPLARRGWSFSQRFKFVLKDFWAVLGFGIILMIPFVNIILIPLAIAGGTMLNLETLARKKNA